MLMVLLAMTGCEALKDAEPWTATITYEEGPSGELLIAPLRIEADSAFGEVQVINNTNSEHGFAVTDHDAATFEKIPAGKSGTVGVTELKDNLTYGFYCQLHDEKPDLRDEPTGEIIVKYLSEEFR